MSLLSCRRFSTLSELFIRKPTKIFSAAAIPKPIAEHESPDKTISYQAAISRLKSERNPDKILAIFDSISRDSNTSAARRFRKLAVKRLSRENNFSAAETLIEKQMEYCKTPDEKFFARMILAYGDVRMVEHAIRTFNQIQELSGVPPSILSFNALLTACNTAKKFDRVPKLFHEIPKSFGISPDKISCGICVKSLCELGLVESAHLILVEMEKKNIEISDITYATILNGCYKNNMPDLAEKIWIEMGEKGSSPGASSYTTKILHYATNRNVEEVSRLMEEMVSVGVKPDAITYRLLMACYYNNDWIEEAQKVCEDMEANGLIPDDTTFSYIVSLLCKKGKYTVGLLVWKQCVEHNMKLNISTLRRLIKGLAEDLNFQGQKGLLHGAEELLRKTKRKYPPHVLSELEEIEMSFNH